jgi:hypothetical protein
MKQFARLRSVLARVSANAADKIVPSSLDAWKVDLKQAVKACYETPFAELLKEDFSPDFSVSINNIRVEGTMDPFLMSARLLVANELCAPAIPALKEPKKVGAALLGLRTVAEAAYAGFIPFYAVPIDEDKAIACAKAKRAALAAAFTSKSIQAVVTCFVQALDPTHAFGITEATLTFPHRLITVGDVSTFRCTLPALRPLSLTGFRVGLIDPTKKPTFKVTLDDALVDADWAEEKDDVEAGAVRIKIGRSHSSVRSWMIQLDDPHVTQVEALYSVPELRIISPADSLVGAKVTKDTSLTAMEVVASPGLKVTNDFLSGVVSAVLRRFPKTGKPSKVKTKYTFSVYHAPFNAKAIVEVTSNTVAGAGEKLDYFGNDIIMVAPQQDPHLPSKTRSILLRSLLIQLLMALGVRFLRRVPALGNKTFIQELLMVVALTSFLWADKVRFLGHFLTGGIWEHWKRLSESKKKLAVWSLATALVRVERGDSACRAQLETELSGSVLPFVTSNSAEISRAIDLVLSFKKEKKDQLLASATEEELEWPTVYAQDPLNEDRRCFAAIIKSRKALTKLEDLLRQGTGLRHAVQLLTHQVATVSSPEGLYRLCQNTPEESAVRLGSLAQHRLVFSTDDRGSLVDITPANCSTILAPYAL